MTANNSAPDQSLWAALLRWLGRPFGGMEMEVLIAVIELLWGLLILIIPSKALGDSQTFDIFWWKIPYSRFLGLPWTLSAGLTIVGIVLFVSPSVPNSSLFSSLSNRLHYCAPLRATGAFLSLILWAVTGSVTIFNSGTILFAVISFCFILAEARIVAGATQRAAFYYLQHRYYGS